MICGHRSDGYQLYGIGIQDSFHHHTPRKVVGASEAIIYQRQ
jgi:hypothetical protein